ncbi:carbohydrate ABC transporter permease [Paenibacillus nasutitermitis]|uniref:Sugar ABC transporter permease n=1 Tax=Paenibacillus nasutitermitis TaxID=1652958 RepID=A0A917E1F0_9BACL|nr:carbohydrate ABC transporter permease [Paenibacillus nasutitermitis]GGD89348.1 sugar ABC transporter permease [Paenibacillus nasutitermitis]
MNKSSIIGKCTFYFILGLGALVMFVPFYWMIATSFKTGAKVLELPPKWIPDPLTWSHYKEAWTKVDFARYTLNSTFLVIVEVTGILLSCSVVAFGLAMFQFKLKQPIYWAMLSTLILPTQVTIIPTYFIWKNLHAFDTYYPLIVPSFFGGAFGIFLIHQFFKSLPKELFEAALIDGFGPWGVLWRIYMPLSKPALSALAIFTFISTWSNTFGPLIYIQKREMYTLPLGLLFLKSDLSTFQTPLIMAGACVVTLPVIIVFLFAQKQFVQGMATTGLKG